MGDARNWSDRKIALEAARAAERRRVHAEAKRALLREVTLYAHYTRDRGGQRFPNWFQLHPCATFRFSGYLVRATCMGCGQGWPIPPHMLDDTPWAHRFWPAVMQELACPACGSCPAEIRFADDGGEVGAISIHPQVTLRVYKSQGFTKPQTSQGAPDPFAQHDDGGSS